MLVPARVGASEPVHRAGDESIGCGELRISSAKEHRAIAGDVYVLESGLEEAVRFTTARGATVKGLAVRHEQEECLLCVGVIGGVLVELWPESSSKIRA